MITIKKTAVLIAILFTGYSGYSQQVEPAYKASLDSLKLFLNPLEKEAILNRLVKAHPEDTFDKYRAALVDNFILAKNSAKALLYFNQIAKTARIIYIGPIVTGLMAYDLKAAEAVIKQELGNQENYPEDRLMLLNIYSQILDKKGDYNGAFAAIKECYDKAPRKSAELTAQYYYLMSKTGKHQEALAEMEKAALTGLADDDFKNELKRAYLKVNPGKDADAYLAGITNQYEDKYKAKLMSKMIDEQAPDFKVTDTNGNEVSLADFKGKTIVMDFWATWCGPCKKSLPAMQLTFNKYKDDPNVKFLLIHTWEDVADPKSDATNYLLNHNLSLPLYMDVKNPVTKKNPAVTLFGISGIPSKIIIDGNGKIRFKTSGFLWPNEAAIKELSAMIELSRKDYH